MRAIQQNRSKHPVATPTDEQVKEGIQEVVHPATLGQVSYFHRLGLRERTLGLVVMVAFVLEMIWRQIGGVSELARMVQKEAILWEQPRKVSQQALSQRLTSMPAELFLRVVLFLEPRYGRFREPPWHRRAHFGQSANVRQARRAVLRRG